MRQRFNHVDLRVRSLAEARPFYEVLLQHVANECRIAFQAGTIRRKRKKVPGNFFL
jgi:hypothetical protein